MKNKAIILAVLLLMVAVATAQDCTVPVRIRLDDGFTNVPEGARSSLYRQLKNVILENGILTESNTSSVVLTVHCDVLDKSTLPGPPAQTAYNLGITLYLADVFLQKSFASTYLSLDGVGTGEVKSYINAFSNMASSKTKVAQFIAKGQKEMIEYYDTHLPLIIKEAERQVSMQHYEEAIMLVMAIPECAKNGEQATRYGLELYKRQLDRVNLYLLNTAKAKWASGQDQGAAIEVCSMLAQIDPEASCYADASKLMEEVKRQVRSDIDFEMRQKYSDSVQIEAACIEAARAIGVAFGNGQKPSTTNLMWLR